MIKYFFIPFFQLEITVIQVLSANLCVVQPWPTMFKMILETERKLLELHRSETLKEHHIRHTAKEVFRFIFAFLKFFRVLGLR
jgi:hypothetical protein